jgi:hypothetical protein
MFTRRIRGEMRSLTYDSLKIKEDVFNSTGEFSAMIYGFIASYPYFL